ncbi:RNA polymerase sigma factor [Herbiconiux daphne]|uniref:Sigma-70 family RNA polymerase sigma factor n=1 Tax=Herbiconiux daphne TaxID=2970914 RepID=A0ABT2GWF7_9MICO|nr:sigma-70 family RNA polymerase sigma factor [Herbiconiux daphne]MCS5732306.1 sigma-70 family RNA polymerase sigma factor [Herbiconiux daphne]
MDDHDSAEAALWQRGLENDPRAFGEIFDLHKDRVFRHAFRLLLNTHDAEDVTGTAFLELWRRRNSVRIVDGSLLPWLLVTVSNAASNARRSTARYRKLLDKLPRSESPATIEEEAVDRLEPFDEHLKSAMQALDPLDRNLVTLVILEGYPIRDAADLLTMSPGSAKTRLSRIKRNLRTDLAGTYAPSGQGEHS